jgi:hypothetical protein
VTEQHGGRPGHAGHQAIARRLGQDGDAQGHADDRAGRRRLRVQPSRGRRQHWLPNVGGPSEIDKVTVDYTWRIMTPVLRPFFPNGEIHFRVESAMKNEARFQ